MRGTNGSLAAAAAGAGVLAVLLGGCGAEPRSPLPTPDVVWDGDPPGGDLESDDWVAALRAAQLAQAVAVNAADFSDEALTSTWSGYHVQTFADRARLRMDRHGAVVLLGPPPFAALVVEEVDGGKRAVVSGCEGVTPVRGERPPGPDSWPKATSYVLELGADGGRRVVGVGDPARDFRLPTGEPLTDELCGSVPIARGLFEPPPDLDALLELDGDDVVAPPAAESTVTPPW